MSIQSARNAAERLVERLGITRAPVDVDSVARSLKLRVLQDDLDEEVSGLLVSRDGSASIIVRKHDPLVRRRFTIAHEIGHYVLRHHLQRNELVHKDEPAQVIYRSPQASMGFDPIEVQANQFAATLLMPTRLLRQQVADLGKSLSEAHVDGLADQFEVSRQAMTIRLTGLGLI